MARRLADLGPEATTSLARDIARAPGSLPTEEIGERFAALEHQFRHDNTIEPLAPVPGGSVTITATSGIGMRIESAKLYYTTDGSLPSLTSPAVAMNIGAVTWDERIGYLHHWQAVIPGQLDESVVRYRIGGWHAAEREVDSAPQVWAHDGQGFWFRFPGESGITTFAYRVQQSRAAMPNWLQTAVIYHIFVDRFHPGTPDGVFHGDMTPRGVHGGTLAGIRRALPHIADLGATCLWLSPIHPAETHHRYDTKDYFGIAPELGSAEDFRTLVEEAHSRGLRVLMDFVPSHCSWHHPAFLAAQADRNAPTYSWFTFNEWPDNYRSFLQQSRYLPSFDTDDPGARGYLIDSAKFWIQEFGVDGFRLDHAIAPSMDFWVAFQNGVESASKEAVTIGETTDTPDSLRRYRGKLNAVLDFELSAALRLTFGRGDWGIGALDSVLTAYEMFMADGPGRVSFLDNHDMDRFLWVAGNDPRRLKLAALCQFTLAATPAVYYGTEIGMTQESGSDAVGFGGDAEARRDMPWDEALWNTDLLEFYRALIRIRREESVLVTGNRRLLHLDEQRQTWAYGRTTDNAGLAPGDVIAAFNLGAVSAHLEVGTSNLTCLLSTGSAPMVNENRIELSAMTGAILRVV